MYILDTETTGLGPNAGVCEIAWLKVDKNLEIVDEFTSLVNPGVHIEAGAKQVHGISDEDVASAPSLQEVARGLETGPTVIGHNCLTGDHEILTKQGWVRLDGLQGQTTDAFVWSLETGAITLDTSATVVRKEHAGDLLCYDSLFYKAEMTPDHVVAMKTTPRLAGPWLASTAQKVGALAPNSVVVPSAGLLNPADALSISPDEARFIEMVRADGSVESQTSIKFAFKKPEKVERCKLLAARLGIPTQERVRDDGATIIRARSHDLVEWIYDVLGVGKLKVLGPWVLRLSLEAKLAWLDEAQYWDANTRRLGPKAQLSVASAKVADLTWLQIMAVTSGSTSRFSGMRPNTRGFSTPTGVLGQVSVRANNYVKTLYKPEIRQYSGLVYCLNTSTGFFLVRRNGAVWVTGNCKFDLRMVKPHITAGKTLCTLALARQYVKDVTNHKLEVLQKELNLPVRTSHSALGDVHTCRDLLFHILKLADVPLETLIERASKPKMVPKMPFGKHKGVAMLKVPREYRAWLLTQNLDDDLRFTLTQLENI